MDWIESIEAIQHARENNQLVVFVGAGVSLNSGIPKWSGLIEAIARKIEYNCKCDYCDKKEPACPKDDCADRFSFTQDEYLRIPEYYFQQDKSEGHTEYYDLIQDTLRSENGPNPIDDEIFAVFPHHIITTNYDSLLEKSTSANSLLYTVVTRDSDLLSKASERYIIKMHGDLESPDTIVLKESDYINYEQEHPLISTFIRSLLVNHTFLFLGYSLNDNNLNLIIGWINYFRKILGVEQRPENFLIDSKPATIFEQARLADKRIHVIDLNTLPNELETEIAIPTSLTDPIGRKLFSYLRCITDPKIVQQRIPLETSLAERYAVLKAYNKISYQDLISVYPLGRTAFMDTQLVFYDKEWYESIAAIIQDKDSPVTEAFRKAGISGIHSYYDNASMEVPDAYEPIDKPYQLYFDNAYIELHELLQHWDDPIQKVYYYHLLGKPEDEIEDLISKITDQNTSDDYVAVLLQKMRARIATLSLFDRQEARSFELRLLFDTTPPAKYANAVSFLRMLFESTSKNMHEMEELLNKHEDRHKYRSNTIYSGHIHLHLWEIKAYAYDYFFFFKENGLPLHYFSDPKKYLSYYLRAILCTYAPAAKVSDSSLFGNGDYREPYEIGDVELDMFVKYVKPKNLQSWFKKYSVQKLILAENVDAVRKFENLCNSFIIFKIRFWNDHILSFARILCMLELDNQSKCRIVAAVSNVLEYAGNSNAQLGSGIFEAVAHLVRHLNVEGTASEKTRLIDAVLHENLVPTLMERHRYLFEVVLKNWGSFSSDSVKAQWVTKVDAMEDTTQKCNMMYALRYILPIEMRTTFFGAHIDTLHIETLFHLITDKELPFSEQCWHRFIETIKENDVTRKQSPGARTFPDWLVTSIEYSLILKLLGFDVDLSALKPYEEYSEHLKFVLDPDSFDYTLVDTANYMWQNLIYSKYYKHCFIDHKDEILNEDLRHIFKLGLETEDQRKIVYGVLLNSDELLRF